MRNHRLHRRIPLMLGSLLACPLVALCMVTAMLSAEGDAPSSETSTAATEPVPAPEAASAGELLEPATGASEVASGDAGTGGSDATAETGPPSVVIERGELPLDFVSDRTQLLGTADIESYFGLLDRAIRVDQRALAVAAEEFRHRRWKESKFKDFALNEFPVFFDLTESPQRWRGKPISLFGHIRLHRARASETPTASTDSRSVSLHG
ncbi:MAG: hypothetical protein R3B90_10555 [Planctomycetaceae bacterium]